jgi:hypothetical protein
MGIKENARSLRYGRAVSSAGDPAGEKKNKVSSVHTMSADQRNEIWLLTFQNRTESVSWFEKH